MFYLCLFVFNYYVLCIVIYSLKCLTNWRLQLLSWTNPWNSFGFFNLSYKHFIRTELDIVKNILLKTFQHMSYMQCTSVSKISTGNNISSIAYYMYFIGIVWDCFWCIYLIYYFHAKIMCMFLLFIFNNTLLL